MQNSVVEALTRIVSRSAKQRMAIVSISELEGLALVITAEHIQE